MPEELERARRSRALRQQAISDARTVERATAISKELGAMIEARPDLGPDIVRMVIGTVLVRAQTERWFEGVVEEIEEG